jgi:hypothetical protein
VSTRTGFKRSKGKGMNPTNTPRECKTVIKTVIETMIKTMIKPEHHACSWLVSGRSNTFSPFSSGRVHGQCSMVCGANTISVWTRVYGGNGKRQ